MTNFDKIPLSKSYAYSIDFLNSLSLVKSKFGAWLYVLQGRKFKVKQQIHSAARSISIIIVSLSNVGSRFK